MIMNGTFSIDKSLNKFLVNKTIEQLHMTPDGGLIYRANSKMPEKLMEYNMFRVDRLTEIYC